jgi:hypothetical protein
VTTDISTLLTALYVKIDDWLGKPCRAGRPPRLSDAELLTLAVAQVLLGPSAGRIELPGRRHEHQHERLVDHVVAIPASTRSPASRFTRPRTTGVRNSGASRRAAGSRARNFSR